MTFDNDGTFSITLEDPEIAESDIREAIEKSIKERQHRIAECGTGTTDKHRLTCPCPVCRNATGTVTVGDYEIEMTDDEDESNYGGEESLDDLFGDADADDFDPEDHATKSAGGVGSTMGANPEVAQEIDEVIGEGESPDRAWEKHKPQEPGTMSVADPDPDFDSPTYESLQIDIDDEIAETLIGVIYRELYEAERAGFDPERLVLGVEQFAKLEAWCQSKHAHSIEDRLPVREIVTVPGPMVHAVKPNGHMVFDHYEGD